MARSTVHYADSDTNNILKKLHNKLRPAGTPVQRVEYIIELLLLRIFEVKIKQDPDFKQLRDLFKEPNDHLLFSSLYSVANERLLPTLNEQFFPFYSTILSQARKVYRTNLSQKVQDQLVLIEEVFKNSNFTNNVKSGNLQEVLGLISEIDEDRLLKTDLLGDAIESALSETGGTKDIGLHRTPDHIRHFMVAVANPTFDDTIFDPACGTAGFLFDSFGYVLESVSQDGHWPGPKAHPEMQSYLKKYFAKRQTPMPSHEKAITFYRTGIFGIEYLGMIRKMAAINFYIRGLNPQNIEQADSLAAFDPVKEGGTKTVVLANPPFGAERDQDAYPNVWEEFSRESETTILFVKLMFDALAPGGRCAVIVSEGFLSWDQTSARTLRKMLIENANLRAIISLPQGVFVSKGGVGPKTSILIFDKSGPTKEVWFYKVTNDGYTMGTNRRPIEGCQLVEALDLYEKYVRNGKTPPETKHSFSVPSDWILALDPRVKLRIQDETEAEFSEKAEKERKQLLAKLAEQAGQDKITAQDRDEKLAQHDEIWKNKTLNEIAKRIERAHLYSFNLPNYRSNLSARQHDEWNTVFKGTKRTNGKKLDDRFAALRDYPFEKAHAALAFLDIQNSLEFDIARQYLMAFPVEELGKHNQLATLRKIIESGAKYPRCALGEILEPKYEHIKKDDFEGQYDIVEKISFANGQIYIRDFAETGMDLYLADKGDLITSKINLHQGAVALAPQRLVCTTHYQVYRIISPDCRADYLVHVLRSPQFMSQLVEQKNKGIKNEQSADFLLSFEIPLPLPEIQANFVSQLDAHAVTIEACKTINKTFSIHIPELDAAARTPIGKSVIETKNGWSPRCTGGNLPVLTLSCLKHGRIDLNERKYTDASRDDLEGFLVREGDFFFSRGNTPELVALAGIAGSVTEPVVFPDLLTRVTFNQDLILPEYAMLLFNSSVGRSYFSNVPQGASPSMVKVSQKYMMDFPVPLLGRIEEQAALIKKYSTVLESVSSLETVRLQSEEALADFGDDMLGINANEATATDLRVIEELTTKHGWKVGDTLLYQPQYQLTPEQQQQFPGHKFIKPDIVLQDLQGKPMAVFENKLDDPKKALPKLRLLYLQILHPRFLYACSSERNLFYDMAWTGLDAGEFRPVNSFLSLEDMRVKVSQEQKRRQEREIVIDKTIAGGYDPAAGKERYYQIDCINALLAGLREGRDRMLVHMATGLGKTRIMVALCKALLETGIARRILFVVDRRLLAEQARDDGFSLISPTYNSTWITTSNYRTHKIKDVHVVVIDTLEIIYSGIPSNYYDLLIVDECHRSINVNRKVIFEHFLCPRIGLTATPRIAIPKDPKKVSEDDLAILDTYRLFGCEVGEPTYQFDLDRGIEEGFLAPYKVDEIKTHLTQIAEDEGIEFDYVFDPDERKKIELDKTKKLKLEQLNRKYLTENTAKRIAEEIRERTEYGEKMILFGVSQAHCLMLAKALNEVFDDDSRKNPRYAEPIISENAELNKALKGWFKKPYQKPYIVVSVDIMSTGVDIPCVRYIGFAALTRSVGKYIQMMGRGTRLDPKTGKFSFQVLDFVGLCKRMGDNGKGTAKKNKKVVTGGGRGGQPPGPGPRGEYFIVDNPDPEHLIQRVHVHEGAVEVVDNIPVEEARKIFEEAVKNPENPAIRSLKQKLDDKADYEPTPEDIATVEDWVSKPKIWLDEGTLQRMYDYPAGSVLDFFLHVLGRKTIPTAQERIETGYEHFISSADFTEEQVRILKKIKSVFASNLSSHGTVDARSIFENPIYERLIGSYEEVNRKFEGRIEEVIDQLAECFRFAKAA